MSEPIDKDTLLPDNRTTFERSYEEGVKDLVKNESIDRILDPSQMPLVLLDLMASEKGVLDWFFSDSENEKRESVMNAISIHQRAGTRSGIVGALAALGIDAEVKRGALPYSIKVESFTTKKRSDELFNRIVERINSYKSERDTVTLGLGMKAEGRLFVGGGVTVAPRISVGPWLPPFPSSSGSIYVAGSATVAMRVHIK